MLICVKGMVNLFFIRPVEYFFKVFFCTLTPSPSTRVDALENVHEEALQTLSDKLGDVEHHLVNQGNSEGLMHQISSKFSLLESRLQSQSTLNERVKNLEAKFISPNHNNNQSELHDRVSRLESKLSSHSDLHGRVNHLESRLPAHGVLSDRVSRVEAQLKPDPEHDRLIMRINSKLDMIENAQRMKIASNPSARLSASAANDRSSNDREEIRSLQDRIDRLTTLRARYAREEKELMN